MDVKEMHIEVEQGIQLLAANARRKMYPEEIDWVLNKVVSRYISNRVTSFREKPGSADSLVHLNRLSTLLDTVELPAYKVGEESLVDSVIPYRVMEVLSVENGVHNLCGNFAQTLRAEYPLHYIPVPETAATTEFYKDVTLTINGVVVFNMQAYTTARGVTFTGFSAKDERWRLVPLILEQLAAAGYMAYWERYDDIFKPGVIIIAGIPESPISIDIDGDVTQGSNSADIYKTQYKNTPLSWYPGRFYFQTNLPQMKQGAFTGTYYRSPLCYQERGRIVTAFDSSFIVGSVRVYHVRRPRNIDLSLSENCELPESAHPDICDLAIEYIKGLRADPDWENKLRDNMTRTII